MSDIQWIHGAGTSVLVGTADAAAVPACCRGIAIRIDPDCSRATAFVPVATSRDVIANAATTRRAAFVVTRPIEHFSIQLKGTVEMIRLATDAEEPFVRQRLEEFADVLDTIGMPRRLTRALAYWPAFAIELAVGELYDQTPGPRAGTPLR
jgi:hypothetical protein